MSIKFLEFLCDIEIGRYSNGQPCLTLVGAQGDCDEGRPIAMASRKSAELDFSANKTCIYEHFQNKGILSALLDSGIVSLACETITIGCLHHPVVIIAHQFLNQDKAQR